MILLICTYIPHHSGQDRLIEWSRWAERDGPLDRLYLDSYQTPNKVLYLVTVTVPLQEPLSSIMSSTRLAVQVTIYSLIVLIELHIIV